ncbi:MAG: hypothetical protein UW35_C0010G0051 [Candidatus Collierbacteria bacterium GW2011_GWF2_44_15]|uniref:Mannosyl-glycoprotein endo-beta-N-acetylglucosamidase-like domain-containing protein n=4 Tax=Candidatus Collieribacteriota TaxID=1752725 RepID=A0A0G1KFR6_9BACT|nr:MAG: hypothetical protein UW23_C0008G0019 [Candidatus Collierbacteria bacterium GW2011_GWA1_44_12]KKT36649.1 MAG: hypothetical protein UW26_C0041G0004 [Candidatus Collierbacteria bacterium GW2011_GWF1_44_12]KKT46694.1 MAG: hypothetical protein UW35_C0010G0051 [Candidatus Collierbacteria bacterium GW2011_GWF2_44_15]
MVKKALFLPIVFLVLTKIILGHNNVVLDGANQLTAVQKPQVLSYNSETGLDQSAPFVFAALPSFENNVKTSVKVADARAEIIRQYLQKYDSPLVPQSELIVELSDTYNFDYRWLVAIAQQESSLCKKIPENSYNCWGWGIYPEPSDPTIMKITRFDSFEDALRRIAPQFTKIFLKGNHTKDPMEVMRTYTPPSDGSWADGVNQFFGSLE